MWLAHCAPVVWKQTGGVLQSDARLHWAHTPEPVQTPAPLAPEQGVPDAVYEAVQHPDVQRYDSHVVSEPGQSIVALHEGSFPGQPTVMASSVVMASFVLESFGVPESFAAPASTGASCPPSTG